MDESAFRRARDAMTPRPCAFEKAMLAGACSCSLATRRNIAERETVACESAPAREECAQLCSLLRQKSAFALKLTQVEGPLSHAQEMKVECGGLRGLMQSLATCVEVAVPLRSAAAAEPGPASAAPHEPPSAADVRSLVQSCAGKYGGLVNLPYSLIVQSVVAYQNRRRRP
ncbi:MAG: hypothetical protein JJE42_06235 [Burkholderiales bacterium]|nr:hypothetical protein [Burkholderiales bacterium]